jgi:transcriptional regulator NrdR family protein
MGSRHPTNTLDRCPRCKATGNTVVDSRPFASGRRRRRRCFECGYRWTTQEIEGDLVKLLRRLEAALRAGLEHMDRADELVRGLAEKLSDQELVDDGEET